MVEEELRRVRNDGLLRHVDFLRLAQDPDEQTLQDCYRILQTPRGQEFLDHVRRSRIAGGPVPSFEHDRDRRAVEDALLHARERVKGQPASVGPLDSDEEAELHLPSGMGPHGDVATRYPQPGIDDAAEVSLLLSSGSSLASVPRPRLWSRL